ncbi:hypothetical protein KR100_01950 [Synechococcus sp. KORDI-100]|uniref:hypothetical protein n=1 Tax=Synechococcus sp. KORDI-100 TaxID=1280380 RepID=UPI0004E0934F|nr:hypothetical protein [Synechococcus sp. KORDI-100]AII42168.1 hypothetical protein KR100_01950 [Synechococcus sp. KORDI-100]
MTITTGAGATERQSDWDVESVCNDVIADGNLSRRKRSFLEQILKRTQETLSETSSLDIADGFYCEEMELPRGSYWCEVIAASLDYLKPRRHQDGGSRLIELRRELMLNNLIDPEEFEALNC